MKIKTIFVSLILIAYLPVAIIAAAPSIPMSKKEMAVKALKIAGYTAGIIVPSMTLSYQHREEMRGDSFLCWLYNPLTEIIHEDEDGLFITTDGFLKQELSRIGERLSLLSCIGYSVHGLCTELKPIIKAGAAFLNRQINQDTNQN